MLVVLVASAAALKAAPSAWPQMGGTLRVQISERVATIDPRQWPTVSAEEAVAERVDSLVFDRLVNSG